MAWKMNVKLISITPEAENHIMYCARVSNPKNQDSQNPKLLKYCLNNGHWSIFEMANMCVEITTSRAIATQILRHKSFSFQEFSQRYAPVTDFELYDARSQDPSNRQNSIDDLSQDTKDWFYLQQVRLFSHSKDLYEQALDRGIAKECARFLLPEATATKLYMNGSIRSWIHYLDLRCANGTQLEHKQIADQIKLVFVDNLPNISAAKGWS